MKQNDLIFDLEQGWAKGLRISFLGVESSAKLGFGNIRAAKQVHGKDLLSWSEVESGIVSSKEADGLYAVGDGFKDTQQMLAVRTADCFPLVYVDRESECVVIIHAGWKGLAKGIHRAPFENKLCHPKSTWIWLGPSLNGMNFQVQSDMWSKFPEYQNDPTVFLKDTTCSDYRYFYSWTYIAKEFQSLGVEMFYNVEVDTFAEKSFASWRRAKKAGLTTMPVQNWSLVGFANLAK